MLPLLYVRYWSVLITRSREGVIEMRKLVATAAGVLARTKVQQWALAQGYTRWLAEALGIAAGAAVSAAIMQA